MRVIAFSRGGAAYTVRFYAALEKLGVTVIDGDWSGWWLMHHVQRGDVVHIHWPSFLYSAPRPILGRLVPFGKFALFLLLLRARGARIVWTAHNLYPHDGGRSDPFHRMGRYVLTRLVSLVLVHGETAAARVVSEFHIPARKLLSVPHGHWLDHFPRTVPAAEARRRLGIAPGEYVFGFVGLCKPYKNLEQLIDSFASLPPGARLLIAGSFQSTDYRAVIARKIGALPPETVILHPEFLADDEIQLYVQAADVLVLPYSEILTSGSVMTAFSFGRPVIVPDKGSMREAVPAHCGIVYRSESALGLAAAMSLARATTFDAAAIVAHARTQSWDEAATRFFERLRLP